MIDPTKPLKICDIKDNSEKVPIKKIIFNGEQFCVVLSERGWEHVFDKITGAVLTPGFDTYYAENI